MSRISRLYLPTPINKKNGSEITLDSFSSNYVLNVLRLQVGNSLLLFDGETNGEYCAAIVAIANKKAVVQIGDYFLQNKESPLTIHLAQGISRGDKMDYTIQKAVELGVNSIIPLFTEYCNVKLDNDRLQTRLDHWQKVVISACEQCGRCRVPKILPAQKIDHWLETKIQGKRIVLDHKSDCICKDLIKNNLAENELTLVVGPEGGLSEEEIKNLKVNDFLGIKLGPRILRTETAALTAISVLQNLFGDI